MDKRRLDNSLNLSPLNKKKPKTEMSQVSLSRSQWEKINNSLEKLSKLDELDKLNEKIDSMICSLDSLETKHVITNVRINTIDSRLEKTEQQLLMNNIRIINAFSDEPGTSSDGKINMEVAESKAEDIFKKCILDFEKTLIKNVVIHGRGKKTQLVVTVDTSIKKKIMRSKKELRNHFRHVYLNDDLTIKRYNLYKILKKQENIEKFRISRIHTKDCKIVFMTNDNKIHFIENEDDLFKLNIDLNKDLNN